MRSVQGGIKLNAKGKVSLLIILLILSTVVPRGHYIKGDYIEDTIEKDTLKIAMPTLDGNLFMSVFNPSPSGIEDINSVRVWYFLHEPPYVIGPDAQYHNYRCRLVDVKTNVTVPSDAIIWNGSQARWVAPYTGKKAKSAVTWECGLGQWADGQPITLADFLFDYAMTWEWAYQDSKNDPYYDQAWANNWQGILSLVKGLKVDKVTNDYVEYTIYQDFYVPYDYWSTAVGNFMEYPKIPWELYNVLSESVAHGVNGKTFSWSTSTGVDYQLNMIDPAQAPYFKAEAQKLLNGGNMIPMWLQTLLPWLYQWGITKEQAGITDSMAKAGYNAVINWVNSYGNVLISNSPYYVYSYDPQNKVIILKATNSTETYFVDKIDGKDIPSGVNWRKIVIFGVDNENSAISGVASGQYDVFWKDLSYDDIASVLSNETMENVSMIKSIAVWWALDLNLVGDPQTGLVNSSGTVKFNPFALPGVRYA
ncbi:hypothetical protein E3E29_08590, partial [Thermococcus sp. Bubb.Bath]|nr:hypothetical protein [Thermococcus sp. Bubb.Bath]